MAKRDRDLRLRAVELHPRRAAAADIRTSACGARDHPAAGLHHRPLACGHDAAARTADPRLALHRPDDLRMFCARALSDVVMARQGSHRLPAVTTADG